MIHNLPEPYFLQISTHPHIPIGRAGMCAVARYAESQGLVTQWGKWGDEDLAYFNDPDGILEKLLAQRYRVLVAKTGGGGWQSLLFKDKESYAEFWLLYLHADGVSI